MKGWVKPGISGEARILLGSRECPWWLGKLWEGDTHEFPSDSQPPHKLCDLLRGGSHLISLSLGGQRTGSCGWCGPWIQGLCGLCTCRRPRVEEVRSRPSRPGNHRTQACRSRCLSSAASQAVGRTRDGGREVGGSPGG